MSGNHSLSELMNAMVTRLEYTHPEEMTNIPEGKQWQMIGVYIGVDPVLAALYKQYCEAKNNLGKLLIENGAQDPMTEIAWDMHDSLRSAIETRLLELKEDDAMGDRVARIQASKLASRMVAGRARKTQTQSLNDMMTFMMLASLAMKNSMQPHHDIRQQFGRAS